MTDERKQRQEHIANLLRNADYLVVRCRWPQALEKLEYARQIVLAELLEHERQAMREEMAASDLQTLRGAGL